MEDISQRESAETLLSAEKHTLQMIAEGAALPNILNDLCGAIDEQSPGLMSMVSLIDPDGQHLRPDPRSTYGVRFYRLAGGEGDPQVPTPCCERVII